MAEDSSELAAALFNEELGAVIQIRREDMETVLNELNAAGLADVAKVVGTLNPDLQLNCFFDDEEVYSADLIQLQRLWAETSFRIQALRDNSGVRSRSSIVYWIAKTRSERQPEFRSER